MAELSTLARPYAKAAFEFAVGASDLKGWADSLATSAAVTQHAAVVKLLARQAQRLRSKQQPLLIFVVMFLMLPDETLLLFCPRTDG